MSKKKIIGYSLAFKVDQNNCGGTVVSKKLFKRIGDVRNFAERTFFSESPMWAWWEVAEIYEDRTWNLIER